MAEPAASGRDFNTIFGDVRSGGVSDRLRDRLVREEHQRLERQGWETATVINLHEFPLTANLADLGFIEVPAARGAKPGRLRIEMYRLSMRDLGDGNFMPLAVLPRELAGQIQREYRGIGGLVVLIGDEEASADALAAARETQAAWWRREYQIAVDSWGRYHQHKQITDRQRDAARALFSAGEVAALPEWVNVTRAQADRRECPMCGESIKVVAKICRFCHAEVEASASEAEAFHLGKPAPTRRKRSQPDVPE